MDAGFSKTLLDQVRTSLQNRVPEKLIRGSLRKVNDSLTERQIDTYLNVARAKILSDNYVYAPTTHSVPSLQTKRFSKFKSFIVKLSK